MVTIKEDVKDLIINDVPKFIFLEGKTYIEKVVLSIEIIEHIIGNKNKPLLFFSLESRKELIRNQIIDYDTKLYVDYTISIPINNMIDKIRNMVESNNIQFVLINSLRFVGGSKFEYINREEEVEEIIESLKNLSNDLTIPILLLE